MGILIGEEKVAEFRRNRSRKQMTPLERQITDAIENGTETVFIDAEANGYVFPQHQREAMARDLGMPKPPAPSIQEYGPYTKLLDRERKLDCEHDFTSSILHPDSG